MDALQSDVEAGFPTGSVFGEIIGDALTVYLTKRYSATPPRASLVGGLPRPRLNRVLEHIHANYLDRAIRLEELANAAGLRLVPFRDAVQAEHWKYTASVCSTKLLERAKEWLRGSKNRIPSAMSPPDRFFPSKPFD